MTERQFEPDLTVVDEDGDRVFIEVKRVGGNTIHYSLPKHTLDVMFTSKGIVDLEGKVVGRNVKGFGGGKIVGRAGRSLDAMALGIAVDDDKAETAEAATPLSGVAAGRKVLHRIRRGRDRE